AQRPRWAGRYPRAPAAAGCSASGSGPRAGLSQPDLESIRFHYIQRALPARRVVAREVVIDGRDPGLDGAPQRPAHVGHEREQVHTGELLSVMVAEVRLAERSAQVVVEDRLLSGVAEVEARVVVAA